MVTLDTNIAIYALSQDEKRIRAREVLNSVDFVSGQVLNEYASVARRKIGREWEQISDDLALLREASGAVRPIGAETTVDAVRIASRHRLAFYDCVLIAVALANDASVLYSEDMQHGLVIDGTLTIVNPFLTAAA